MLLRLRLLLLVLLLLLLVPSRASNSSPGFPHYFLLAALSSSCPAQPMYSLVVCPASVRLATNTFYRLYCRF